MAATTMHEGQAQAKGRRLTFFTSWIYGSYKNEEPSGKSAGWCAFNSAGEKAHNFFCDTLRMAIG
jgi:hypothetical protein